jgi:hypothetical protein
MSFCIKAVVELQPGCRLYYACPLGPTDDPRSTAFFKRYHGKYAKYVGPSEKLYGPLNHKGKLPGRYASQSGIKVCFEGETQVHEGLNLIHFVVIDTDPSHVRFTESTDDERLGDLPHPLLFYPEDSVRFKQVPEGRADVPRFVSGIWLEEGYLHNGLPGYQVHENDDEHRARAKTEERFMPSIVPFSWNMAGENLELVARGNVWALYNDPSKLSFASDNEESAFWAQTGISKLVSALDPATSDSELCTISAVSGLTAEIVWQGFQAERLDLIQLYDRPGSRRDENARYRTYKLKDCFQQYRERVRALTTRLWESKLMQDAA